MIDKLSRRYYPARFSSPRCHIIISYWTHSIDRLPVVGHLPGHLRRLNGMKAQGGVMEQSWSFTASLYLDHRGQTLVAILASPFRFRCTRRRHSLVENFVRMQLLRIALERTTTTLRSIGGSTIYCSLQQNKWLKDYRCYFAPVFIPNHDIHTTSSNILHVFRNRRLSHAD